MRVKQSRYRESLRHLAGAISQIPQVGSPASAGHVIQSFQWLNGSDQNRSRKGRLVRNNVEAEMHPIREVNVRVSGRPEHNFISTRHSSCRVARGIIRSAISFGFDYTSNELSSTDLAY